ncbi:hypothetical protein AB0D78_00635 [Streptomyces avermitilis]|uniref:hypothetical protein n=1 Tax=Streptomyces avermitilis TaxID=33903 RepID=UPI0033C7CB8F
MAEHDSDREPEEKGVPIDEEAAWAAIVAGYGDEPPDPPGAKPFKSIEDLALLAPETNDGDAGSGSGAASGSDPDSGSESDSGSGSDPDSGSDAGSGSGSGSADKPAPGKPLGSSVAFAPGIGGGPRDYAAPDASEDDFDEDDEGHFVPPEPPPLPAADATAKFAWLAVVGGPILLLLAVLLGWDMTWWLTTVGIGGFLGGFATLVMRMRTGDEDDEDPGRGAVV